jgi:hypothetical protein
LRIVLSNVTLLASLPPISKEGKHLPPFLLGSILVSKDAANDYATRNGLQLKPLVLSRVLRGLLVMTHPPKYTIATWQPV